MTNEKQTLHIYCADGELIGAPQDQSQSPAEQKILELTWEYLKAHPGLNFQSAYLSVKHQNPDLAPEIKNHDVLIENAARQDKIKDEIKKLRNAKPFLSFSQAWEQLQRERPELFNWS